MGASETVTSIQATSWLDPENLIDMGAIVVQALLAWWIVRTTQNRVNNRRVLKDYFINEVKVLRDEYATFLNKIHDDSIVPSTVTPYFKMMNIKANSLTKMLHKKYKIEQAILLPYKMVLPDIFTNSPEFNQNFRLNKPILFSDKTKINVIKFQQDYSHLFTDLVMKINEA